MFDKAITVQISANQVSWYAAIVSTLNLAIFSYNIFRDRARVKILFSKNRGIVNHPGFKANKPHLNITVINTGRRPVKIAKVGLRVIDKEKPYMIFANSIVMPPNNTLVEENPRAEYFAEQDNEVVKRIWFVWVEDSTGKTYRKDIYLFPTLWRILFWLKYKK